MPFLGAAGLIGLIAWAIWPFLLLFAILGMLVSMIEWLIFHPFMAIVIFVMIWGAVRAFLWFGNLPMLTFDWRRGIIPLTNAAQTSSPKGWSRPGFVDPRAAEIARRTQDYMSGRTTKF